ncbi:hypothetical protein AVEN_186646-1 [Araneus ventricosus]|uniref:Uncharacterized protein n=1 Tax=Araneus ventricosus TaxID=182803 RepID=A0A4Y2I1M0_ARAVE|nr:hypothetical protein AVEN_186646-1 [Araneus ventricosus]
MSTTHKKITPYEVAYIFNQAYMNVATVEKGRSGFKFAGMYPINPDKFKNEKVEPTENLEHLVIVDEEDVSCVRQNDVDLSPKTVNKNLPQADTSEELTIHSQDSRQKLPELRIFLQNQSMTVLMQH